MTRGGLRLGWTFSVALAAWSVAIFWIALRREVTERKVFRAPPSSVEIRAAPVQVAPVEMPPPLPLPTTLDVHLPPLDPVPPPVRKRK